MPTLRLDIVVLPTYNTYNLAVVDASTYPTDPPTVTPPTLQIDIPGFPTVYKTFVVEETNIFNSTDLGITTVGNELPIPDGIYYFKYTVQRKGFFVENLHGDKNGFLISCLNEINFGFSLNIL